MRPNVINGEKRRLIELDFLRGVAILLVLAHHSPMHNSQLGWLEPFAEPIIGFGWTGVDLFFVLSGFLVGGLMFSEIGRTGKINVGRFLVRRGFKLWPSYIIFIGYYFIKLMHRGESAHEVMLQLWPNFLHVQNYALTPPEHTWSLAVEEHFYLILPFLLIFLTSPGNRTRLRSIPWITAAVLLIVLSIRIFNMQRPYQMVTHLIPTHLCIDRLFIGVFLSYCYYNLPEQWSRVCRHRWLLRVAGFALISPMLLLDKGHPFVFTVGYSLLGVGYAALLASVVPLPGSDTPRSEFWRNPLVRCVAWAGVYSYSIYLWHLDLALQPIFHWLHPVWSAVPASWQFVAFAAMYIPASVLSGFVMGRAIEIPFLKLREKLFKASPGSRRRVPSVLRRGEIEAAYLPIR